MNRQSDEWLTPPEIIEALGPFDLDPATPPVMPWLTAAHRYTAADNGLLREWYGRVWLNPPFSKGLIGPFMKRMAEHNHGTALVNARTDTIWFTRSVWQVATAVLFIYQRVKFVPVGGRELARQHGRGAAALIAYGAQDADRLADSGIAGAFVPLPGSCQVIAVYRPGSDMTWAALLAKVVERQGGEVGLTLAYALIRHHPKATANQNWKPKVRQILQGPAFERIAPATYRLKGAA